MYWQTISVSSKQKKTSIFSLIVHEVSTLSNIGFRYDIIKGFLLKQYYESIISSLDFDLTFFEISPVLDLNRRAYTDRELYNINAAIAYLGGLLKGLTIVFLVFIYPFREISYYQTLVNEMFDLCYNINSLKEATFARRIGETEAQSVESNSSKLRIENDAIEKSKVKTIVGEIEDVKNRFQIGGLFKKVVTQEKTGLLN